MPPHPNDQRGWWSSEFVGQIIFYDAADLAAVAKGEKEPYGPQPYAFLEIDKWLFNTTSALRPYHVRGASYDRERGLLYVFEFRGDGDRSLVHVWKVKP